MIVRRAMLVSGVVVLVGAATTGSASAHGVGKRGDLPLPLWQFVWAAVFAIGISVAAATILWTTPRLARLVEGPTLSARLDPVLSAFGLALRLVGLLVYLTTMYAAFFVSTDLSVNIAPWTVFVALWIGMQFVSVVFGDVYALINPLDTIAASVEWVAGRLSPDRSVAVFVPSHWPATIAMAGFLWLELAYHSPASPRLLGGLMLSYSVVYLIGAWRYGRRWLALSEGFAAFFTILSALAPVGRNEAGSLRLRVPGSGLAKLKVLPGTSALVLVTLGGTSFDGLSRTDFWSDVVGSRSGWALTLLSTFGLVWMIGVVAVLYEVGIRAVANIAGGSVRQAAAWFTPSLVPIALGYAIAHYFSLFVLDGGQDFLIRISDPLNRGWDLFGTSDWQVNFLLVSATAIAWVQGTGIVAGHVAGVLVAHDRALEVYEPSVAVRTQYPMVAVMVLYTVGALVLLLGA